MKKVNLKIETELTPYQELINSRKELINDNAGEYGNIEHQLEFVAVVNGVAVVAGVFVSAGVSVAGVFVSVGDDHSVVAGISVCAVGK